MTRGLALVMIGACGSSGSPSRERVPRPAPVTESVPADAAISPDASPAAGSAAAAPIVVWNTGNGWVTLSIEASGLAHYDYHPSGRGVAPGEGEKHDVPLDAKALARFEDALVACKPCALVASTRTPVPEEGHQSLHVALPSLKCDVELLSNDWNAGAAGRCAQVLDGLTERVRTAKH
jgi:hypothetical protein